MPCHASPHASWLLVLMHEYSDVPPCACGNRIDTIIDKWSLFSCFVPTGAAHTLWPVGARGACGMVLEIIVTNCGAEGSTGGPRFMKALSTTRIHRVDYAS